MRIEKLYPLFLLIFLAFGLFLASCQKTTSNSSSAKLVSEYDHTVISDWDELFLQIERYSAGYRPGPAPRAMALIGLANYESCISGMPRYNSVANLFTGLDLPKSENGKDYHWPTVINASYAFMLRHFFPTAKDDLFQQITTLENSHNDSYKSTVDQETFNRSVEFGQAVASAVWEWSKTDTWGHEGYLKVFQDPTDPTAIYDWQAHYKNIGDWVATLPGPDNGMFPAWGKVRTFVLTDGEKLCPPPLDHSDATNSQLYAQALEVYAITHNLSYNDKWTAEFWSDDLVNLTFSPGPRFLAIADEVFQDKNVDLETALYCSAKMGMAISDGVVACWYSKYYYNYERPVTYINRVIDPNWTTILDNPLTGDKNLTPSFPTYPSGHSTMAGAATEILSDVFGYDYSMTDRCHKNRTEFIGTPRFFNTFYDMGVEDALSRVPLGVHFRMDCTAGLDLGRLAARKVNALPWKK